MREFQRQKVHCTRRLKTNFLHYVAIWTAVVFKLRFLKISYWMARRAYALPEICCSTAVVYCASLSGFRAVKTVGGLTCIVELEKQVQHCAVKLLVCRKKSGVGKKAIWSSCSYANNVISCLPILAFSFRCHGFNYHVILCRKEDSWKWGKMEGIYPLNFQMYLLVSFLMDNLLCFLSFFLSPSSQGSDKVRDIPWPEELVFTVDQKIINEVGHTKEWYYKKVALLSSSLNCHFFCSRPLCLCVFSWPFSILENRNVYVIDELMYQGT